MAGSECSEASELLYMQDDPEGYELKDSRKTHITQRFPATKRAQTETVEHHVIGHHHLDCTYCAIFICLDSIQLTPMTDILDVLKITNKRITSTDRLRDRSGHSEVFPHTIRTKHLTNTAVEPI